MCHDEQVNLLPRRHLERWGQSIAQETQQRRDYQGSPSMALNNSRETLFPDEIAYFSLAILRQDRPKRGAMLRPRIVRGTEASVLALSPELR